MSFDLTILSLQPQVNYLPITSYSYNYNYSLEMYSLLEFHNFCAVAVKPGSDFEEVAVLE